MVGAALDRFDGVVERIVRGQDDDLGVGMLGLDLREHVQTLRIRQLQIEQQNRRRIFFEDAEPIRSGRGGLGLVTMPAKQGLQGKKNRPLVVDDENAAIFGSHGIGN
jgi:hypothetical protein